MAAAEKLSYEARFGDNIRGNVAAVRAAMTGGQGEVQSTQAAQSATQKEIKGKHTNWFTDGKGYGEEQPAAAAQQGSRYKKITPGMALKELAAATLNNMNVMGEDGFDEFEKRMRRMVPKHRMVRSIKASILNDKPHFGSCRIGKVPLKRDVTSEAVIVTELQYYIANFNTVISTDDPAKIHTPQGNDFGRTFFGVVVDINETTGKALGFNKTFGKEGVVFQTGNPKDALMFMTAFSSGKQPKEIAEMMEMAAQKVAQETSAPGMRR
jgi:hypothetical protein